jgi:tripartite-type tricarboxylate transporter receptor subunit TctC
MPTCPYDPQTDFRAIAQAGEAPLVLLCNNNVPGSDYASTMAAIAKEPKKYFFALSSGGSAGHIATLEFLRKTKLPIDTILYKGTAPANADLLSGSVSSDLVDGAAAARHLGQGAWAFRHLQGAHQARAQHPDIG